VSYHRATMLEQRIQQQFFDSADLKYQLPRFCRGPSPTRCGAVVAPSPRRQGHGVRQRRRRPRRHSYAGALFIGRFERERPAAAIALPPTRRSSRPGNDPRSLRQECRRWARRATCCCYIDPTANSTHSAAALLSPRSDKDMTVIALAGRAAACCASGWAKPTCTWWPCRTSARARVLECTAPGAALPVRCGRLSTAGRTGKRMTVRSTTRSAAPLGRGAGRGGSGCRYADAAARRCSWAAPWSAPR
jgi:D-sedoheptulose 7-phosphate isomerase